jgi:hypothetical protein
MSVTREDRMLELARQRLPELRFNDLDVVQTGMTRWSFVHRKTGDEFRRVECDPIVGPVPPDVVAFTVDAGDRVHFLRPRATG